MENLNNNQTERLIISFLEGNSSIEESDKLIIWINESEENRKHFMLLKNLWESSRDVPVSTEKAMKRIFQRTQFRSKTIIFWQLWQKVAAVLLFPLIIASLWLVFNKETSEKKAGSELIEVFAPFGSYTSFELPDGSKVWLNAGSSIEYPEQFSRRNRMINMTGEAYFEVKSDKNNPFLLNTPYFIVKATGTRFNVMTYLDDNQPAVTLIEGKVSVCRQDKNGNQVLISALQPDQHMIYNTLNGNSEVYTEDIYKYIAWKDGKLVFRNDPLSEVARKISRQYNVDVEIKGQSIQEYKFRASFENEPLNELLRLLKISSPIDFSETEPVFQPDGTFSKRKIIIFPVDKK